MYKSKKGYYFKKINGKIKRISKESYSKSSSSKSSKSSSSKSSKSSSNKSSKSSSSKNSKSPSSKSSKSSSSKSSKSSSSKSSKRSFLEKDLTNYIKINKNNNSKNKILGSGSYGKVYQGTVIKKTPELSLNNKVAVKFIKKKFNTSKENNKTNVDKEIEILMQLDHPNIVKLYTMYENSNNYKLVLEIINGKELYDYIKDHFSYKYDFKTNEQWIILKQVANALNYIHNLNIIHRDLKPENIMYDGKTAKLIDFGFAVQKKIAKRYCGSSNYMAPEVVKREEYTSKIDVWSYGVLIYEIFTGKPAYYHKDKKRRHELKKYKWDNRVYGKYVSPNYLFLSNQPDFELIEELLNITLEYNKTKRKNMKEVLKLLNKKLN